MLLEVNRSGAISLLANIFSFVHENLINEIISAFFDTAGMPLEDAEIFYGEIKNYADIYLRAEKAYRDEIFEPWLGRLIKCETELKNEIADEIKNIASLNLSDYDVKKNGYQMKKAVSENVLMAEELAASFSTIGSFYDNNAERVEGCADIEIVKGIYDTVAIKTESIEENKNEYIEEAGRKFAGYKKMLPELNEAETTGLTDEAYRAWIEKANGGEPDAAENIFKNVLASVYFSSYKERLAKYTGSVYGAFAKQDLAYKRDCLLFEISTYNEIMNYSVTRLMNSEDGYSLEFAGVCEEVRKELTVVLSKNNITLIDPPPHAAFNGKEHEVLVAEESPGFLKGEIIKVINPGYKRGAEVLSRATVIAAKQGG